MKGKYHRMMRETELGLIVVLALAASLAGLGTIVADPSAVLAAPSGPAPGSYELSFQKTDGTPVSTLPVCTPSVCEELVLKAHVGDSNQQPAQRGVVIFQYCSLKGLPPNDITRPDEAPKADCENGSATWADLGAFKVNGSGDAFLDFGIVLIPRTVGFRFRYIGQGSGIANGVSDALDFTWF